MTMLDVTCILFQNMTLNIKGQGHIVVPTSYRLTPLLFRPIPEIVISTSKKQGQGHG